MSEFGELLQRLQHDVQFPAPRGQSRLLPLVPESTIFYSAFPNYGDAAHQALKVFHQELERNAALRAWWQSGEMATSGPKIEESIEKFYQLSQYLGDEIVVSSTNDVRNDPRLLVLAEVRKPGLKDFLPQQVKDLAGKSNPKVRIFDLAELAATKDNHAREELAVLVRPDFVAVASDLDSLRKFNARVEAKFETKNHEFASAPFGQRVLQAYAGGATILAGIDLHKILAESHAGTDQNRTSLQQSGFADAEYLLWEHKTIDNRATSQVELSFTGPRHGIASWLSRPGPMGSLDFVSPQSIMATTILLKSPAQIFDDLKELSTATNPKAFANLSQMEALLRFSLRDDLLALLSGEITFELDSVGKSDAAWKAMLQASDPVRLQATLSKLMSTAPVSPQQFEKDGVTYHTLRFPSAKKTTEIGYAFVDGYLIVASSPEGVTEAIRAHRTGTSLANSKKFLESLPPGNGPEASALVYEDPTAMAALSLHVPDMVYPISKSTEKAPTVMFAYADDRAIREVSLSKGVDAGAVLIGAAIAIPNLLRARIAANESSAVATIRTVNTAQVSYSAMYPQKGYARDLATLGGDPAQPSKTTSDRASLIDATLGNAACIAGAWCSKSGFQFSIKAVCKKQVCEDFVVVGTPFTSSTGTRSFCSMSDAVIRFKPGRPLTTPISIEECQTWSPLR
jgi:type II secretory pathway pseudopilin PulG